MNTDLMKIRQAHGLTTRGLADEAGVPLRVAYLAEIGGNIDKEDAHKLLNALSRMTGKFYTLEMLGLNLKPTQLEEPTIRLPTIPSMVKRERRQ